MPEVKSEQVSDETMPEVKSEQVSDETMPEVKSEQVSDETMPEVKSEQVSDETMPEVKSEQVNDETILATLEKAHRCYIPKRYIFILMNYLIFLIYIFLYGNINIAVVAMVNITSFSTNNQSRSDECPALTEREQEAHKGGDILWSPQHVGLVLGATALGSMITKIPGGRLAELFGCKKLIGILITISSLLTMLTPLTARWGSYPSMALRLLTGFSLGPVVPGVIFMLGRWITNDEKNLSIAIICSGGTLGTVTYPIIFASLCDTNFLRGWPSVFYVSGFLGLVWAFFWFLLIHETPAQHPNISDEELKYILENLNYRNQNKCLSIPWKKIFTSIPFWALISGYFLIYWSFGFFVSVQPLYLGTVLHMPITKTGLYTCLPQLFKLLFQWLGAYVTHWTLKKKFFSSDVIAKSWISIYAVMAILSFLGITLVGCNETLISMLFILSYLASGVVDSEIRTIGSKMVPALSGTVTGIAECFGVSTGFIIPAVVGHLVEYEQTMAQWNKVFYINMAVIGGTSLFFVLFGTTEPQPWAVQAGDEDKEKRKPREINAETESKTERNEGIIFKHL